MIENSVILFLLLLLMELLRVALILGGRHGHANKRACVSFSWSHLITATRLSSQVFPCLMSWTYPMNLTDLLWAKSNPVGINHWDDFELVCYIRNYFDRSIVLSFFNLVLSTEEICNKYCWINEWMNRKQLTKKPSHYRSLKIRKQTLKIFLKVTNKTDASRHCIAEPPCSQH